jgi:sigma-B regulation protein RsbU (phosphoserine phosphatase)
MNALTPPPPPPSVPTISPLLLIVDDSAAQRNLLAAVLWDCGLGVVTAPSAEAALEICRGPDGGRIRIVVSDWQMPGLDGPKFCAAFRALRGTNFAYFILMTSRTDGRAKTEGLRAGADDFVTRPVNLPELRARIETGRRILYMHEVLEHRNHEVQTSFEALRAMQEELERDLAEARKLQRAFLPATRARFGASELSLRLLPCQQIGGDLVGWFPLSVDEVALYAIDVSGHGIASALMTGRIAGLFADRPGGRNVAFPRGEGPPDPPEAVMRRLNDLVLDQFSTDIYFTALLAYISLIDGTVRLCQAGHPHPIIRRADGSVERLGRGGPPVGLLRDIGFEAIRTRLGPGDVLLAYSDGVTECIDTWGEMLEEEGLMALMAGLEGQPEAVIDGVEAGLRAHAGIQGFEDDISMVAFRFWPQHRVAAASA